jgi:valyl-tRNA synthetase
MGEARNGLRLREDHPAHDPNDYEVGQAAVAADDQHPSNPTARSSSSRWNTPARISASRSSRPAKVVADLDALGLLGEVEDREIDLPTPTAAKRRSSRTWLINGS